MSIDSLGMNRELMRISGLSSGLDTDAIVNSLLKIDQYKVDRQFEMKTQLEWKRDAYRDVNLMLRNFREDNMSVLKTENNMLSKTAYNNYDITMLDTTNAVTIKAGYTSTAGMMTINSITQLATSAKTESLSVFNTDTPPLDVALIDLDLVTSMQFVDNEISFSINDEVFTFGEDALLSEVLSTVNANSDAGVSMSYSSLKKGFSITAKTTGVSSEIDIVNIKGNTFDATSSAFGIAEGTYTGQNAMLTIENIAVTKETNSFTIDGISYALRNTSAETISFNIERDVESTVDKVKNFIESYNELLETLQSKVDEPVYKSYKPLTDESRGLLSESQAEKWDEMAKSGLLKNDSNITSLINNLRNSFYTTIEGTGKIAADIGLRTGSYQDKGKILIDEDVLRQAIESNPQEIENIFVQFSDAEDYSDKYNQSGVINRISDLFINYTKNATYNTIANADNSIVQAENRMKQIIATMERNEERYWAKFTAMETALSLMNSQASALLSQFSMTQEQ